MEQHRLHISSTLLRAVLTALALTLLVALPTAAIEWTSFEGTARGYPVMRDLSGRRLADGDFTQWIANDRLHVRVAYAFESGRRVQEEVVFRQRPHLSQESWSFRELQGKKPTRTFAIDFRTGVATAAKDEKGEIKHWSETLDVAEGQTFAGFGFTMAIKAVRERLVKGEVITLKGIGFAPKPTVASVEISYAGHERIRMAGRTIATDRFTVHPKIPAIAKLFVKVPDAQIWLNSSPPVGFLRWEGALAEPDDPIIRVDLMPGATSEAATPVATSGVRK